MKISVSTNPPKEEDLLNYLSIIKDFDVDYIHADIMDGVLVENKTFGATFLPKIRQVTSLPLDVHLMVQNPQVEYKKYLQNGVDCIAIHYECLASNLASSVLKDIQSCGIKSSLAIKIETPLSDDFLSLLSTCDRVLVMSVKIGKSGQTFDTKALDKIKKISDYIKENNLKTTLEVDGGVTPKIVPQLTNLGVSIVVVGGCLYNSQDKGQVVAELKNQ